ncbi:cytochrome o ubiquinol oxidase subunit IV [uncultured Salinisphaera sp.]|uniref:cytochrome o ubiquinol oxidase subunit IV n=1 Tax=uncultured Salinisphaera sp. TaxID=359372 RepID=UPI0032B14287|tara:strand:+ start:6465 stop:6815 length:351 start_codon:yes stop_codon:yes gene_type:complete
MSHSPAHEEHHEDTRLGGLNLKTYITGFVLSLILTVIPFGAVGFEWFGMGTTLIIVAVTAVVQILVQMYFFLHLDFSPESAWNTGSALFSLLILAVLVGGTLWLFYSLEMRTMMGM